MRGAGREASGGSLPAGLRRGSLKQSVFVSAQRGAAEDLRVTAVPGEDVVVLEITGGPSLLLHPEHARDLLMAQQGQPKPRGAAGGELKPTNDIRVPIQLQWRGLEQNVGTRGTTRGFLGDVLLKAIHIVTGIGTGKGADLVADKVVERFDNHVDEGLYRLDPAVLSPLKGYSPVSLSSANGKPLLVFVHGTFSDTSGTFGKFWLQHPGRVQSLFDKYEKRVYALDHATLGVSPIHNALTLAKALPSSANLHLVTHSRGGLVAEVFAKVCADPDAALKNINLFPKSDHDTERQELNALAQVVKKKNLRVERIVRVACPARGTLLASKRLDAYLSILKWALELAEIPVLPALVDFIGEVAQRRADPTKLPGLAAQIPDSPLVQWIHHGEKPIEGDLRVVAGDIEGDSLTSWLKTLLADAFYWTDNDFVVHTRAMYGGAPRAQGASFLFDQGGNVSHFRYFSNETTADAITKALLEEVPTGFRPIGPLSWAGQDATGVRAARRSGEAEREATEKPALFLLPGILGSNLKVDGKRVWLAWRFLNGLSQLKYPSRRREAVQPDGPIGHVYDELADYLSETHEVIEFAFDWRKPMEEEARRLASAVEQALAIREKTGQPVRILAHSMGGLVARVMGLERPGIWKRMLAHSESRILMLGTPNCGSWVPMQVLSSDDPFSSRIVTFGAPFNGQGTRQMMAEFPGLMQLQAGLLDEKLGLSKREKWEELAKKDLDSVLSQDWWHIEAMQRDEYAWGVPPQEVLNQATGLHRRLEKQRQEELVPFRDRLLIVTGQAPATPDGYVLEKGGLSYVELNDGDGRVTRASAQLPGCRTWSVECEHGKLPSHTEAFKAYRELLETGNTKLLPTAGEKGDSRAASRAVPTATRSRPSRTRIQVSPPESTREAVVHASTKQRPEGMSAPASALRLSIINGDLKFVRYPLMIGHYRSMRLTGSERVMNNLVDGVMAEALKAGLYPDRVGAHQVFVNTHRDPEVLRQMPWPEAVIVAGLGEEGKLRAVDLIQTIRQATIAWAQRMTEKVEGAPAAFDLAATLIGSGGIGISPGQSAQLIAEGVRQANQLLADSRWPRVGHLYLIEIFPDRASEAWRALSVQATATPTYFQVTETIQSAPGAYGQPPDQGYRGVGYDFITVVAQKGQQGEVQLSYAIDTNRAATELRAQATQSRLLESLVVTASNDRNTDLDIRRALFRLLVPIELEAFLGGTSEMVIELDEHTAGIPWELLDTDVRGGGDKRPWAIRAKLLRKLRADDVRTDIQDAGTEESVLIIGEPKCDPTLYPRLPGARSEARAVYELLTSPRALDDKTIVGLISSDDPDQFGADALTVAKTLLSKDWRMLHIAGHGEPPEKLASQPSHSGDPEIRDGDPRGVVLSDGTFLGPREILAMRVVPELVFINCCHLGARNIAQLHPDAENTLGGSYHRPRFAATVAGELIKIGVRCVIAAGWAVDDAAAKLFAVTFYQAILRGCRFIDAVGEAREAAWGLGGNTWAAYQCYGEPDWTLRKEASDPQRRSSPPAEKFSGIASPHALVLTLNNLAVDSQYHRAPADTQRALIRYLEAQFGQCWGEIGSVAEAFGWVWSQIGDKAAACSWYDRALKANDGTASIKCIEQLNNLRGRQAWDRVKQAIVARDQARERFQALSSGQRAKGARTKKGQKQKRETEQERRRIRAEHVSRMDEAERSLTKTVRAAREDIHEAVRALLKLTEVETTSERESLLGSAYKRLVMVDVVEAKNSTRSLKGMEKHYRRAESLARTGKLANIYYPALNRMAAELILKGRRSTWAGFDVKYVTAVRQNLESHMAHDPDFWAAVGLIELRVYEAVAAKNLAATVSAIQAQYQELYARVSARRMWGSVADQLQFLAQAYKFGKGGKGGEGPALRQLLNVIERLASAEPTN